jgi:REP element-mobilizing transposase RayT
VAFAAPPYRRRAVVLGYHLMFSAYGFWLPNDPRGSGSFLVRGEKLREFGPATKVRADEFCARKPHDRARRLAAKGALDHAPVTFTGVQARAIARGFANSVRRSKITIWACAVLPDHIHLVVARQRHKIEILANLLKGEATRQLVTEGVHPFQGQVGHKGRVPSCFGRKWWVVYKDNEEAPLNAIAYVERNPIKAGFKPQDYWTCATRYPEWYESEGTEEEKREGEAE